VPVFVLNSVHNDVMAGDEDPLSGNGNPHPEHPSRMQLMAMAISFLGFSRQFKI
jgi:hypothetical protein